MKKITLEPEFEIIEDPRQKILNYFKENKMGYPYLIARKTGVSNYGVRTNLEKLEKEGMLSDLGLKTIKCKTGVRKTRVYQICNSSI